MISIQFNFSSTKFVDCVLNPLYNSRNFSETWRPILFFASLTYGHRMLWKIVSVSLSLLQGFSLYIKTKHARNATADNNLFVFSLYRSCIVFSQFWILPAWLLFLFYHWVFPSNVFQTFLHQNNNLCRNIFW